jgi:hypothetical protein
MAKLTKQKLSLMLNDIYLKSKRNETFNPSDIMTYYHLGQNFATILRAYGYCKKIDTGKYTYIGKSINEELINEIYNHYMKYKKKEKEKVNEKQKGNYLFEEKDNKQQVRFLNDTGLIDMIFKRNDELNKKVNELEKSVDKLYEHIKARDLNKLHENKFPQKKSFFSKLF